MDRLDEIILDFQDNEEEVYDLLVELKQRRESALRPATKFLSSSIADQFQHVMSEMEEVINELNSLVDNGDETARPRSLDECNDWQISIETLKAIIEPDEDKRRESMIKTIKKNTDRKGGSYYAQPSEGDS